MKLKYIANMFKKGAIIAGAIMLSMSSSMPAYAAPRTINSYGIITSTDDNGATVTIDADDIRANYAAIYQIQQQLAGLSGKTLEWSDDMSTYVIVTYKTDENGDIVTDDNGKPVVETTEAIGALGTADPTMVVENRTFSSLYAKTIYTGANTLKSPGVQQNGTLVDVLNNGFTAAQVQGRASYADNDTTGTGTSTRNKDQSVGEATGGARTNKLSVDRRVYSDPASKKDSFTASAPVTGTNTELTLTAGQYTSAAGGKYLLNSANKSLTLGINESVTLPAGYYSSNVTINNGVVNQTTTGKITISDTVDTADASDTNKTASAGNKKITIANGTYDISKFDTTTSLALGAEGKVTIPAGYYAKNILIQNASKDILSGNYGTYTTGTEVVSTGTGGNNTVHPTIDKLGDEAYILGINETVTLPAGYYSKQVKLKNGVTNNTSTSQLILAGLIGTIDEEEDNQTSSAGNLNITTANDTYDTKDFNDSTNPINLGAGANTVFPAGYYSRPIKIASTVKDILGDEDVKNITNSAYTAAVGVNGNNTSRNNLTTENTALILGINEQTMLPAGYYSKSVTISNGVRDRLGQKDSATKGTVSPTTPQKLPASLAMSMGLTTYNLDINEGITLPAGYYAKDMTINNGVVNQTEHGKVTISGTVAAADTENDNKTAAAGNKKITIANGTYDVSKFDTTTSLALGAEGRVTIPAGYYAKNILIQNTSKDILSGNYGTYTTGTETVSTGIGGNNTVHPTIDKLGTDDYVLGINETVTLPAGYYSKQVKLKNGVTNQTTTGKITISDTVAAADTADDNKTASAGNKKITVANGTYDVSKFDTTTSLALGAEGKVTIPAGYYAKSILIQNTSKDILSGNYGTYTAGTEIVTTGTGGNNTVHPTIDKLGTDDYVLGINETVTLPAGYYSKQVKLKNGVTNNTESAKLTLSGLIGSKDTDADNQTATAGNLYITTANGAYDVGDFNATTNPVNLGAGADTIFPAGYYSQPVKVANTVKDILGDEDVKNITNSAYTAAVGINGNNTSRDNLTTENTALILGYNEQTMLPAGYYSKPVTISNGVRDRLGQSDSATKLSVSPTTPQKLPESMSMSMASTTYNLDINEGIKLPAGFYANDMTINNGVVNQTEHGKITISGTVAAADTENDNKTAAAGNKKITVANGEYDVSDFDTTTSLALGAEGRVTMPAGYYANSILIQNSSKDIISGHYGTYTTGTETPTTGTNGNNSVHPTIDKFGTDDYVLGVKETVTLPAGYYSKQVKIKNGVVPDLKGTANFTAKTTGSSTRIGTSSTNTSVTNLVLSGQTLSLGVDETITIPAGYYSADIRIANGVVHRTAVNTKVSANNNTTYGTKSVSYGEGYYDSISVTDNTPNGTITVKKSDNTTKTWNPATQSWS